MAYYEFNGNPFGPAATDWQPMVSAPRLLSTERHVVDSDLTIVDTGGKGARHFTTTIQILPAAVPTWEALLGETATLRVAGVDWANATLLKLDNARITPRAEYWRFDADWVVG